MDGLAKIIVVCGPTATGKSALALELARRLGGELVNADSMQVYRGLVVGTAAITAEEAKGVPVHLSGFLSPEESYSAAQWVADAATVIDDIAYKNAIPVVCGGTGLYIQSLVKGVSFSEQKTSAETRKQLENEYDAQGGAAMLARLAEKDPEGAGKLAPGDRKRVVRAWELWLQTGQTAEQRRVASLAGQPRVNALCIGLDYAERADLYGAINRRVDAMMARGLLAEARMVWENRECYQTARQAIGYKEFFPYFEEKAALDACVEQLKKATRNYAKRQLTWFRHMDDVHWLDVADSALADKATNLAREFVR